MRATLERFCSLVHKTFLKLRAQGRFLRKASCTNELCRKQIASRVRQALGLGMHIFAYCPIFEGVGVNHDNSDFGSGGYQIGSQPAVRYGYFF